VSSSQPPNPLSGSAGDDGDRDTVAPPSQPTVTATPAASPSPSQASGGSLIVSPGGSVTASCQSGLAYLQYWSPNSGYQADDVIRGPAARASIGFEQLSSEYVISVTCNGSLPVAHVAAG
jgi:serine/threonine-protein kinase